jgi:drug/metabolite transporter (DMT)-like permease
MIGVKTVATGQQFVGLTGPFRYVFIAFMVLIIAQFWLVRPAMFRRAAQRGGWRLIVAVMSSACMLVFGLGIALGHLVIAIAALVIAAPPTWLLFISLLREGRQRPE